MWIYETEKLSDKTWQEAEHCVKSVPIRTEITQWKFSLKIEKIEDFIFLLEMVSGRSTQNLREIIGDEDFQLS